MRPAFDLAPELTGETLHLRPLRQDDFEALHAAASDPATWAGHPSRNRHERDVFRGYFDFLLASGGTLAIIDRSYATHTREEGAIMPRIAAIKDVSE